MRALTNVRPTAEQLALFANTRPGADIIRGAAGSGKTTTALLKLRTLITFYNSRREKSASSLPIKVLVLTYNTTLKGYIEELVSQKIVIPTQVELEVQTFAKWSRDAVSSPQMLEDDDIRWFLTQKSIGLGLPFNFVIEEVEYLMSKFLPENLSNYLIVRRDGRGASPRVDRDLREQILNKVVNPYIDYKRTRGCLDWNDLAVHLCKNKIYEYDIVVTDETQDFSANQIRAILNQLSDEHSLAFVLDTAQRIYARGFTWAEVGLTIRPERSHRLSINYRNTKQIAALSASLLTDLAIDDDATIPNFRASTREGEIPLLLEGKCSQQINYVLTEIIPQIDLSTQSVAFLHPKGGGWFKEIRASLKSAKLPYVEISRKSIWPDGPENIALSTIHSAKGLEFDHVIILGLNAEVTRHGVDEDDDTLSMLRRLLAMGISRAKISVVLGYKNSEKSDLIDYLDPATYRKIEL